VAPDDPPPLKRATEIWTPSGRRLTPGRRFLYRCAVPVALGLVRFWWASCGRLRVVGDEHLTQALADGPFIPVYWHDAQLFCVRYLLLQRDRGLRLGFLISPSVDGELPAMIASRAGFAVVRGSSSHTGAHTLRAYHQAMREGISTAVQPDGPSGPRHVFKLGAVLLAQMLSRSLLPVATAARPAWRFPTWDRFQLPWPFARVAIAVGAPRRVPRGLDAPALEQWQRDMAEALEALEAEAQAALKG
jgi:lysophospholipid acyltransferase (LPLAT)-like uncharacterized protein